MAKPYSEDLRRRVVGAIEGGTTIPEAAEQCGVSISSVVRFLKLHRETGSVGSAKFGGYKDFALAAHEDLVRQLVAEQPDITLAELEERLAKKKITVGKSSISRFLNHWNLPLKKSLRAAEQDRPDVAAARRALQRRQKRLDPRRLVFIDETSVTTTITRLYGRAPQGERLVQKVLHGNWKTVTFIAALRNNRVTAPFVLEGAMNGEAFKAFVEQFLAPTLKNDDIVFMDNASCHMVEGVEEAIEARGAILFHPSGIQPARLLEAMAGYDQNDPSTAWSFGNTPTSYVQFLKPDGLRGARIGLPKTLLGSGPEHQEVNSVIATAMVTLKSAGAELIELDAPALDASKLNADNDVQKYEFKTLLNAYLAAIPNAPAKSLAEIIASGKFHKPSLEKFLSSAESFANGLDEPDYKERLLRNQRTRQVLISFFAGHKLDALVYPLQKRLAVPLTELNQADRNGILASVTGFPAITVPAGFSPTTATAPLGVPVGMDILGKPWSEGRLIELAYSFEQEVHVRKPPSSAPALLRQ